MTRTGLDRLHRRLIIVLALSGLVAFSASAGFEPISAILAGIALIVALVRPPGRTGAKRLERIWIPLAGVLLLRIVIAVAAGGVDVVIPVVDLLLLLLCAEALRGPGHTNDVRLYALIFALFLAATAYRPGVAFGLAFASLVVLGSLTLAIGLVRRKVHAFQVDSPPIGRRFVTTSVALSGVTLMTSAIVFVTFPRISRDWSGRGDVLARSIAGFADEVSLGQHGSSIYSNPEIVLRVEFPEALPENPLGLHWRGRSYDRFDGIRWSRTENQRPSNVPTTWYRDRWPDSVIEQRIYAAPLDTRVVFGLHPLVGIDTESRIQPLFDQAGDFFYWGNEEPIYTAWSMAEDPPADELRAATRGFMPDRERYLQLPRLPDRIAALADSIAGGLENRYDQTVAIRDWLRGEFGYTRELPATAAQTSLDYFLFERREGHCEYFSTAMVVMLRSLGIHARNVNGFLGGRWNEFGQYLAVTQNEAHSWVEVWFPGYGWVEFDPTPGGSAGAADADLGWLFPGMLWFDGIQFRWNKWILDYSLAEQVDLFGAIGDLLNRSDTIEDSEDLGFGPLWIGLTMLALLAGTVGWLRRGRSRTRPESVAYLALLDAARRAGLVGTEPVTPNGLLSAVASARPAAEAPARALVDRYQRVRFGGEAGGQGVREEMADALRRARRAISSSERVDRREGEW